MLNRLVIFQEFDEFPSKIQVHFYLKVEIIAFHIHFASFTDSAISSILMGPK